ncbi:hypothetical protein J5N97_015921 [Dioscorea zingiberensis]|uniref:Uncharacterized protein n=1 Tax=Dioscorea zingiberensis TaxID=325984 RepID=A0A9D5CIF4_9LILI|nr:hypothetical protein J5N97_015921 [Dioscorea zingiberensis]
MLLPVPRLTNSLRGPFGVDRAYLHRKSLLQNRQSKRSKDDLELARKLVPRWDEGAVFISLVVLFLPCLMLLYALHN